jgi:hypothetical protein
VIDQRDFRRQFGIHHNHAVPSAHVIKTWVQNFKAIGSTLKKKGGSVKAIRTPENIAVVRETIERSPHHSACRHSVSLRLSEASVRRILHKDLHFYHYSGFGGLVVTMQASGTQDRRFAPGRSHWIFQAKKS